MTRNFKNAATNNTFIANDYYHERYNNTQYTREEALKKGFKRKPKSSSTIRKEQSDRLYLARKNICDKCFMTKQLDGNHNCE